MEKTKHSARTLTVQIHEKTLNPRTFRIPMAWLTRASLLAWLLILVTILSTGYALKSYWLARKAHPEMVSHLENEVQELKIALEKKNAAENQPVSQKPIVTTSNDNQPVDPKATDEKAAPGPGKEILGKDSLWTGLAANITAPQAGYTPPIRIEEGRIQWQGKYVNFSANVIYTNAGRGSQQGHIVALSRSNDRIFSHPEGVLNTAQGAFLFEPSRGEYFSVARFRVLKAHFGPFDSEQQLSDIQVFLFDSSNKLILNQVFHYGK